MYQFDIRTEFHKPTHTGVSPVTVSLRKDVPSAGSSEADRILGVSLESDVDSNDQEVVEVVENEKGSEKREEFK